MACVVTTTSCFAPRAPDDVVAVAKLCQAAGVPHVINNAYGIQSSATCAQITSAWRKGDNRERGGGSSGIAAYMLETPSLVSLHL